ncbi:GcrA family cell cycle regulator [Bradyrhizobium lablabi]|nr:GcrA family cell cycle regulator [Bradyrhizobium lablabi]
MTITDIVEARVRPHRHHNSESAPWYTKQGMTDRLVALHRDGLGFTAIARILAEEFQLKVTKNQVIGKARRLTLPPRRGPDLPRPAKPRKSRARPHAPLPRLSNGRFGPKLSVPLPAPDVVLQPLLPALALPRQDWRVANLPVLALKPGECRFPFGDPPFQFCGRPQVGGCAYCAGHLAIAFRPRREW